MADSEAPVSGTKVSDALKRKVGPLPAWGWGVVFAGALGGFLYLKHKNAGATALPVDTTVTSTAPSSNGQFGAGSTGGGSGGGSTGSVPPTATPPTDTPTTPPTGTPVDTGPSHLPPVPTVPPVSAGPVPVPTPVTPGEVIPPKPANMPDAQWDGHAWVQPYRPTAAPVIDPKTGFSVAPPGQPAGSLPTEAGTYKIPPSTIPPISGLQSPTHFYNVQTGGIPQTGLVQGQPNYISIDSPLEVSRLQGWTAYISTGTGSQYAGQNWTPVQSGTLNPGNVLLVPTGYSLNSASSAFQGPSSGGITTYNAPKAAPASGIPHE